jgi:hypothetical protein
MGKETQSWIFVKKIPKLIIPIKEVYLNCPQISPFITIFRKEYKPMKEMQIEWKGEVTFKGSLDDFKDFAKTMNTGISKGQFVVTIPVFKPGRGSAGYQPFLKEILSPSAIAEYSEKEEPMSVPMIGPINGGLLFAHLHIGDKVVALDRAKFKKLAEDVAVKLAARSVDANVDFNGVMGKLQSLY